MKHTLLRSVAADITPSTTVLTYALNIFGYATFTEVRRSVTIGVIIAQNALSTILSNAAI